MKRLAIIGAASGQLPLVKKAKEMGLETICIAYEKGAVCKEFADYFIPISITEKDAVVEACRKYAVAGVVSNASDMTAEVVAYVSEQLGLPGTPYSTYVPLRNKYTVRNLTKDIPGFTPVRFYKYDGCDKGLYPCIIKPCCGNAKKGVSFVENSGDFKSAIKYATVDDSAEILVEEFISGRELSVEAISHNGAHQIVQITDKDSSGPPHFVELGHHQPANIPNHIKDKIYTAIPALLEKIGYTDGASHVEVKYSDDNLWLIEANLRGGGDFISNELVFLSSGVDYLKCMIEVSLGLFAGIEENQPHKYSGVYFLCKQTQHLVDFFVNAQKERWFIAGSTPSTELTESRSNYEHNGYIIYQSDKKIVPYE